MTTNQTIDGVPRDLREEIKSLAEQYENAGIPGLLSAPIVAQKLRALLDAPAEQAEFSNADNADQALMLLDFALSFALCNRDHGGTRRDVKKAQAHLEAYRNFKSAQPQGEPVAWIKPEVLATLRKDECCYAFGEQSPKGSLVPLYAEPPAPVAVVLPEREAMRDIIAQAIGGDAYDCTRVWSAWGVGTMSDDDFIPIADQEERLYEIADACLDELKRLNPSL